MSMPGRQGSVEGTSGAANSSVVLRRACASCEAEEDDKVTKRINPDDEIHGKLFGRPAAMTEALKHQIRGLGHGQPLPASERAFFEPRFGRDFGDVRVHSRPEAAAAANTLRARAFTHGSDIVFGAGEFSPGTRSGRQLLAHELTHVVQQKGGAPAIQRELATPPPATPARAQPALTAAQITAAIRFNRSLYDAERTKQLQDLIGTTSTGTWVEDDILAVAATQEEYGLHKDGMIGPKMFEFLDKETRLEKLAKTDENCLLAFNIALDPPTVGAVVGGQRSITGHFAMSAQFSKYCGCADYEYRQFIRGHWKRIRGGVTTDLSNTFTTQPAGSLTPGFAEDGNTTTAALNYGHRDQANEGTDNGYFDDANSATQNQASGCHYKGDDTPGGPDSVLSGDVFDILVAFRGEIRRKAKVVETKFWNAIHGRFPVP